jgi:hypothetical protein
VSRVAGVGSVRNGGGSGSDESQGARSGDAAGSAWVAVSWVAGIGSSGGGGGRSDQSQGTGS